MNSFLLMNLIVVLYSIYQYDSVQKKRWPQQTIRKVDHTKAIRKVLIMLKHIKILFFLIVVAIGIIFIDIFIEKIKLDFSLKTIKLNWNIELPNNCDKVYSKSTASFHGDGPRYQIFQYDSPLDVYQSNFTNSIQTDDQIEIIELLDKLEVNKEYYPNFSTIVASKKTISSNDTISTIYLLYDTSHNLYIVEFFV